MKKLMTLALTLLATGAFADEEVIRSVDASPDGFIYIVNTAGDIDVIGWSRKEVEVNATLGENVEELILERDGDEVVVKVKVQRRYKNDRGTATDLVVHVPEKSSLKVASVRADINVRDVQGSLRVHSVSGDIEIDAFAADIDVESVSGDIEIAGSRRDMRTRATSVSGDVEATNLAGDIEARSVTGDVTLVASSFSGAELNTTNGDIVYRAELRDKGRLDVETINGDVELKFHRELSARFDIETFNGSIDSCFGPKPQRKDSYAPGRQMIFNEGAGSGRVVIRTLNGDLRMCRD